MRLIRLQQRALPNGGSDQAENQPRQERSVSIAKWIVESWWLFLFAALILVFQSRASALQRARMEAISSQMEGLCHRREELVAEQRALKAKLRHGQDPAWIEQVLMKQLGLAPKGYTRVEFQQQAPP